MILPTIRASLSRSDAQQLVRLLGREDPELGAAARIRLKRTGLEVYRTTRGSGTHCSPPPTSPSLKSRSRSTIFSPPATGSADARILTDPPACSTVSPPSCGFLFTEMSVPYITLIRDVMEARPLPGRVRAERRTPSMRYRIRTRPANGSRWMSLAPEATAS